MKRHFPMAVLFTIMTILLTGCSDSEEYKSPGNLAKERQNEIVECFINEDGETLKSLFSEYVVENYPDIDTQIQIAFDSLDSKIVSYDAPFSSASGSREQKDYGATTRNIITDNGTEYIIAFKGWLTNDKEPNKVGTTVIVIQNKTMIEQFEKDGGENTEQLFMRCIGETD